MESTESLAGCALMVGIPGTSLDDETRNRLTELRAAGLILFARNLESAGQTRELVREVREMLLDPAWVAIDQEGGRVSRLKSWIGELPTAVDLANAGPGRARAFGRATAEALIALGINLDFAPVVDLCGPETTNGIGDRSFGVDPHRTALLAGEFLAGLQDAGVAGCLKHFPGLGDTHVDSHLELPRAERDLDRLRAEDLVPYRVLGQLAATLMVGHAHYPALDEEVRPGTTSRRIVQGLLRDEVGYTGLVVTDDLEMGAIRDRDVDGHAAIEAIEAGCDMLLYCADLDRALAARDALATEARKRTAFRDRLTEAARRVSRAAADWPPATRDVDWNTAREELASFAGRA